MRDILVVGAGPVGLSAAMGLVRFGLPVRVIEAEPELSTIPKASTLHPPTLEILAEWGVLGPVQSEGLIVSRFQYWDRATSSMIAEFDLSVQQSDTPYPYRVQCEQHKLTRILLQHLWASGLAVIEFNARFIGLERQGRKIRVFVERPWGLEEMRCDVLIGADGASSTVRRILRIAFNGLTYPEKQLLICVEDYDFRQAYPNLAPVAYFFDHTEWVALIQNRTMWKFLTCSPNEREEVDPDLVQEKLRSFVGAPGYFKIRHATLYQAHQRVAERFYDDRVVIIGDAAHINTPLGGMGMNSGIHDAYFLAGVLAEIARGGKWRELETFAQTRKRIIQDTVQRQTWQNQRDAIKAKDFERRMESLARTAADPFAARAYLLKTSMIEAFRLMQSLAAGRR